MYSLRSLRPLICCCATLLWTCWLELIFTCLLRALSAAKVTLGLFLYRVVVSLLLLCALSAVVTRLSTPSSLLSAVTCLCTRIMRVAAASSRAIVVGAPIILKRCNLSLLIVCIVIVFGSYI
jgi:hypothetical protein